MIYVRPPGSIGIVFSHRFIKSMSASDMRAGRPESFFPGRGRGGRAQKHNQVNASSLQSVELLLQFAFPHRHVAELMYLSHM